MDLSIIVVHYRTPHLLTRLLDSLFLSPPDLSFEVYVLDNGDDESRIELLPRDSRVSLYALGTNVGFAKAANEGMRKATGHYFLLANSDVEFPAGSVASLVETMDGLPQAGALGVRLEQPDGRVEVNGGSFPTLLSEYRRRRQIRAKKRKKPEKKGMNGASLEECDWVTGACLLLRRKAVEEVGYFDENFFLYYEDVDLCTRLWQAGWLVYYLPTVVVIHHRGASCSLNPDHTRRAYRQSQRYFWRKHHGLVGLGFLRVLWPLRRHSLLGGEGEFGFLALS